MKKQYLFTLREMNTSKFEVRNFTHNPHFSEDRTKHIDLKTFCDIFMSDDICEKIEQMRLFISLDNKYARAILSVNTKKHLTSERLQQYIDAMTREQLDEFIKKSEYML